MGNRRSSKKLFAGGFSAIAMQDGICYDDKWEFLQCRTVCVTARYSRDCFRRGKESW